MSEGQQYERKSLRKVLGTSADFADLAQTCVCFANGNGGQIAIGIEDDALEPPADQRIDRALLDKVRRRIPELTVNVHVFPEIRTADNGGEFIMVVVQRSVTVASTTDGRYFIRAGDSCRPVTGDDVLALLNERPSVPWEALTTLRVDRATRDASKVSDLAERLRRSERVTRSTKEKTIEELLDHYGLARGPYLTNLGVLLVGHAEDRANLRTAPVVQVIRFDERGVKIGKLVWDDYARSPIELVDEVWAAVPDFRERYEVMSGLIPTPVNAFDEDVIREVLVNAIVHRPYTQGGDIFLNLYPDRLVIVNPGRLPLGVTPRNILHASRRRNDGLARVFHDVQLMEREGSGFDLVYERLLATGRGAPVVEEGADSVRVTVPRRVLQPAVIRLLQDADERFHLNQRERIVVGLLAQSEGLSAVELASRLELEESTDVRSWLGRLVDLDIVRQVGRTRATRYFLRPDLLRSAGLDHRTTLARVQPHRLRALILEDLERFPSSSASDIRRRIGTEIPARTLSRALNGLAAERRVSIEGKGRWRRYSVQDGLSATS